MRSVATGNPGVLTDVMPEDRPDVIAESDLELLLLIRHFELALLGLYERGELNGTTHTCLGQEYVPVAVSGLLRDDDHVFSNHRGHGHYLARFRDADGLLAEIMGRTGAICGGVGGSQHIRRPGYLSTGVQGESLPVAVGTALHLTRTAPGALVCAYIGDGTWGEGGVYEALNLAALWRLPLLVVVEHNGIAQSTPTSAQMAGTIAGRAAAFGIGHVGIDTGDIPGIRALLGPMLDDVRAGQPLVAEFRTHRLGPHSKGDDSRPEWMIREARDHDWYTTGDGDRFRELDAAQQAYVAAVVADVSGRGMS
jgi:acetoin:2,6-dichlorophenolindophenol oxidoreductase subunit alpha